MNEERAAEIVDRISEMEIELDYDPIQRGPKFLNNQIAQCRNYINEVQNFARECQMLLRKLEHDLRVGKTDYELQFNDLMANDPEIKSLRTNSKADREAVACTRLQAEQRSINDLQLSLVDIGHIVTIITAKLHELKDVNRDIRLQRQLIQSEIETGAMWGNDIEHDAHHVDMGTMSFEDPPKGGKKAPLQDDDDDYNTEDINFETILARIS